MATPLAPITKKYAPAKSWTAKTLLLLSFWQFREIRSAAITGFRLKWARLVVVALCLAWVQLGSPAVAAEGDVYVAYDQNGTPRYANYPLDTSYVLLKKETPDAPPQPPQAPPGIQKRKARLDPLIERYARQYQLSPALVSAIIAIESGYNPAAVSPKGAKGVMQLMPATAARYGARDPHDAAQNIEAGVRYLKALMARYKGNIALTLAAYNAGEGAVSRHGASIPPYRETMLYVPAVMAQIHDKE